VSVRTKIRLPWPSSKLNGHAKGHWRAKALATKRYREACAWLAKEAAVPCDPQAILTFTYYPPNYRRRDAQNMPGMLKAAVDGIADAMGCDDREFRCRFPDGFEGPVPSGLVVVEIETGAADV
jgi:crossover junction endodeoxyribonuclease RusA